MHIVIEISDYDKEWITNGYHIPEEINIKISEAITKGIQLPKGHGDLIDRQLLINNGMEKGFCDWYDEIKYADIIIEADIESEDKDENM